MNNMKVRWQHFDDDDDDDDVDYDDDDEDEIKCTFCLYIWIRIE